MLENGSGARRAGIPTAGEKLAVLSLATFGMFGGLSLLMALADTRFGAQMATAVTYTCVIPAFVLSKNRLESGYSLHDPAVERVIPRLLRVHAVFLIALLIFETVLFALKPHLPPLWLKESGPKHDSAYEWLLILLFIGIGLAQTLLSRSILRRSASEMS